MACIFAMNHSVHNETIHDGSLPSLPAGRKKEHPHACIYRVTPVLSKARLHFQPTMQIRQSHPPRALALLGIVVLLAGCAVAAKQAERQWRAAYGDPEPRMREVASLPDDSVDYWTEVKPILEARCVTCHACYDAACQLKATAIEGIERGFSKDDVYNVSRLLPATPTRLFEDARSIDEWRDLDYKPVLNEYANTPELERQASVLYRSLELKEQNPLPNTPQLDPDEYTFGLSRNNECPTAAEYDSFAAEHPGWGMPYALPGLDPSEQAILKAWVATGANYTPREPLDPAFDAFINDWEAFLNRDSLKGRLVSRYIYEHLYLSNLYFPTQSSETFFRIIRSSTPPGEAAQIIATRRPFDDPGVERVYYRLVPELETIVDKTHNPYRLDTERLAEWEALFFEEPYEVSALPGYAMPDAANPFVTFVELPLRSRYRFMLAEAQSSIMNYIKGSVCRGQVAVNVIRDQFWVFFVNPDSELVETTSTLLPAARYDLALANSTGGDTFMPGAQWVKYERLEKQRREARDEFMVRYFNENPIDLDLIWDGDGNNSNAGLTVFRHLDSATVEQGLIGDVPQTVWVIDYTLLERIHYLLVAGYDVYGTLGHHFISRLHMDFLRMDGETNFINFLPRGARDEVRRDWYRDAPRRVLRYLENEQFDEQVDTGVTYITDDPRRELAMMMRDRVGDAAATHRDLSNIRSERTRVALERLSGMAGANTRFLAEMSMIRIDSAQPEHVTLMRNNGHLNMVSIFNESKRLQPEDNTVTVAYGFLGSYPNAFLKVDENDIERFVDQVLSIGSAADYQALLDNYGIRRTNPSFWQHSDDLMAARRDLDPLNAGVLDYSRLENR